MSPIPARIKPKTIFFIVCTSPLVQKRQLHHLIVLPTRLLACKPVPVIDFADETLVTVVKEFRSKMFGQHPGYFKAVFLKKTQIIIVSIYEYTVYIMF